jgi:hypothetical protein
MPQKRARRLGAGGGSLAYRRRYRDGTGRAPVDEGVLSDSVDEGVLTRWMTRWMRRNRDGTGRAPFGCGR